MAPTSTLTTATTLPEATEAGRRISEEVLQKLRGKRIAIPNLFQFLPGWEATMHSDVDYISLKVNEWVARYY